LTDLGLLKNDKPMSSIKFCILFFALIVGIQAQAKDFCDSFWNSQPLSRQIDLHQKTQSFRGAWDSYFSFSETVVFTDLKDFPTCALAIINGKSFRVGTASPLTSPNGIYHFYLRGSLEHQVPLELEQLFIRENVRYAAIYSLSKFPFPPEFKDYDQFLTGFNEIHFIMSLHESFHFNVQYLPQKGESKFQWPEWNIQPDLNELNKSCYENTVLKVSAKNEFDLLIKAFKLAVIYHQPALAKSALVEYDATKRLRYAALSKIKVPTHLTGIWMTCPEAEENQELLEGTAEYYGLAGALWVGIINPLHIAHLSESRWTWKMPYYSIGALKLFILNVASSESMSAITSRITASSSFEEGLSFELDKVIQTPE